MAVDPWSATPPTDMKAAAGVVSFWRAAGPGRWFEKDPAFDAAFRARFLPLHLAVAWRRCDHWGDTAEGSLALIVLTDQFPRNAFRGTAHMYATDSLARGYARRALVAGHDLAVEPAVRLFFYLPFAHSEELADQAVSVEKARALGAEALEHARGHQAIVRRFGRFPHRNAMLGRDTSEKEAAFLEAGGFSG